MKCIISIRDAPLSFKNLSYSNVKYCNTCRLQIVDLESATYWSFLSSESQYTRHTSYCNILMRMITLTLLSSICIPVLDWWAHHYHVERYGISESLGSAPIGASNGGSRGTGVCQQPSMLNLPQRRKAVPYI